MFSCYLRQAYIYLARFGVPRVQFPCSQIDLIANVPYLHVERHAKVFIEKLLCRRLKHKYQSEIIIVHHDPGTG